MGRGEGCEVGRLTSSILPQRSQIRALRPRLCAALLFLALALSAVFALPGAAFAHAALVATEPADGSVLADGPKQFSLTFSEPVSPLVLTLVRPDGTPVPLSAFRLDGQTILIDVPPEPGGGRGTHVLSWRVISADGHPVGGSILFSVGAPSAAPAATEAVDWWLRGAIWLVRTALYAGLFLGIGGAFAVTWLEEDGKRDGVRFAGWLMLLGLAAAPAALGLQGLDALGASLPHLAEAVSGGPERAPAMAGRCCSRRSGLSSASRRWRCGKAAFPGCFRCWLLPASARPLPPAAMPAPPRRNG